MKTEIENRVLLVGGSPRAKGNTDALLAAVAAGLEESGIPHRTLMLRDLAFQPCIGCEKCRKDKICTGLDDDLTAWYPEIRAARGLAMISPVHNYNVTAWIKAFIDRLYCFYDFTDHRPRGWSSRLSGQGRAAVIGTVCEQETPDNMGVTLEAMEKPLEALGYDLVDRVAALLCFDRGVVREDQGVMNAATAAGRRLAESLSA